MRPCPLSGQTPSLRSRNRPLASALAKGAKSNFLAIDGFEFIRQADSIAGFMTTICTVNDALLRSISGHTYYHDGKTDTQWYAQGYEHD